MGISTDHHTSREGIIFKDYLVNDTGTGAPETNAIFIGYGRKEIKYFLAFGVRVSEVFLSTCFCYDKVVAMYGGGNSNCRPSRRHELEQGHLSRSVLHGYTVGSKIYVRLPTL